jgi:NAD+ kinase
VLRLIKQRDPSVANWKKAHSAHVKTLAAVEKILKRLGARVWVLHGPRVVFDTTDATLVVTVGGDGTLLAASHHVVAIPVLGINSSPHHSVGFFCPGHLGNAETMLAAALDGKLPSVELSRMQVDVNGRVVSRRVLNETLFCHPIPAAASRYILKFGRQSEEQLSSGFWVGTAAGSTGATHSAGGEVLPLDSGAIQFVSREPFAGLGRKQHLTHVIVPEGKLLSIVSKMHEASLFLDGPFQRAAVRLGDTVTYRRSDEPIAVLGIEPGRARILAERRVAPAARARKRG